MSETNSNQHYKCPHCNCIFLTKADLQKHMSRFGEAKEAHAQDYSKTHGRLEHGYGDE